MQIKVFSSSKLHDALAMVRQDFGPDAAILDRHKGKDEQGNTVWHVHAARDMSGNASISKTGRISELNEKLEPAVRRLERIVEGLGRQEIKGIRAALSGNHTKRAFDQLIRLGVAPCLASDIAEDFAKQNPVAETLLRWGEPLAPHKKQEIVLLAGPSGAGKTTLAAKIATHFSLKGISVAFMSTATERIGGLTILQTYADLLGAPLIPLRSPSDIPSALVQTKSARLVLVDSDGWINGQLADLRRQSDLWRQLPCSRRFVVVPANMDEVDGSETLSQAHDLGIAELALSKLDETGRPGKLINWAAKGAAISYCSFGPEVPEQMGWLSPKALTSLLVSRLGAKE